MKDREEMNQIVVAGAGAAGMMAALTAAEAGGDVIILEPNEKPGRKLSLTGNGRCNVTNDCSPEEMMESIPRNPLFLSSALRRFTPQDTIRFFTGLGVPLKTEPKGRVFPCSDRASDVVEALSSELRRRNVRICRDRVLGIGTEEGRLTSVQREAGAEILCEALILATGGASYPQTGSTGDGYRLAEKAGHTVVPIRGSLVPLESEEKDCAGLQGLSLKNAGLRIRDLEGRTAFGGQGEVLFTHFGLSGPLILSASAHMDCSGTRYAAEIDLMPGTEERELDARLLREIREKGGQKWSAVLQGLVPRRMIPALERKTGIPPEIRAAELRREQRSQVIRAVKHFEISITGTRPVEEAVVTAGGVKTGEVHPGTMESKLVKGLYFAGELLDVDGDTGGFNLQIAWATGYAAGLAAAAGRQERRRERT